VILHLRVSCPAPPGQAKEVLDVEG
jgi:hypothetical protein